MFSKIYIVDDQGNRTPSIALAPVAVLPQFQKQGIGTQLIERGLSDARVLNFKSAVVLGHPTYYPKFGFVKAEKWSIKAPFDVPSEAFMAIELVENTLQGIAGTVEYPKEFQEVS
ncbi:Acetyltransferase (GNAT) family protein [compost metagenome]